MHNIFKTKKEFATYDIYRNDDNLFAKRKGKSDINPTR